MQMWAQNQHSHRSNIFLDRLTEEQPLQSRKVEAFCPALFVDADVHADT